MSVFSITYKQLVELLPKGRLWRKASDRSSVMGQTLVALAQSLDRVHQRAERLVPEGRPLSAVEALPDWEEEYGLPDACTPIADSIYERQVAIWRKQVDNGSERPADYIALAARLGYVVEIEEFDAFTTESTTEHKVLGDDWLYVWSVNVLSSAGDSVVRAELTTESTIDERVDGFSSFNLECVFGRANPADLLLLFSYAA